MIRKLLIAFCLVFGLATVAHGAFSLELIYPKAAGSGTPAIPSTHRIFYAYPGIEYNIRAAVIGGVYPYTYALSNAPSGMTIKSRTGEITWTNPTESASDIVLTVTDSASTQVQGTWSITVTSSTDYFLFVQTGYSGSETGTISQPYSSISNLLNNTSGYTKIVYFRTGTYTVPAYGEDNEWGYNAPMNLTDKHSTWLVYPGESVTLNGGDRWIPHTRLYFDGFSLTNWRKYCFVLFDENHYHTIRRCTFTDLVDPVGGYNNQGFYFAASTTVGSLLDNRYYVVIQDSSFTDYTTSMGIGDLYNLSKALIENNTIVGPTSGSHGNGIMMKQDLSYITVRGNSVIATVNGPLHGMLNDSSYIEVCYNMLKKLGGRHAGIMDEINNYKTTSGLYFYRNTIPSDIVFTRLNGSSCGGKVWSVVNNVIINPNTNLEGYWDIHDYLAYEIPEGDNPWNCVTDTDNLKNTSTGIIDAAYKLTGAYTSYVGTRGWQLSDGYTPMELGDLEEPSGGTTSSMQGVNIVGGTLQ